MATRLPPHPPAPRHRRNPPHHGRQRRTPRRRPRTLGDGAAPPVGQAQWRSAMDARSGSRNPTRQRGRETKPRTSQADKWALHLTAAQQYYEREGHLQVPRKHVERIVGEDQEEQELRLGAWVGNQRSRAATLSPERTEQLSAVGMRWT
ncbi:helicase associated domain-containing protein [Streptomyces sp. NBC_01643]|uniref:helicase associated domain-containing protein n=2 Tax=Streptomyces sp. NBC_01643 TaxID=2975906 RepID=UPI003864402F